MRNRYLYLILLVLALVPWFLDNRYVFHVATMITIMIPMALSMNLMLKIGQLSIAQPAFMGIGAYGSALLAMRLGVPPALALLAGALIATAIAVVVGPLFLRIKGVYFVLLTYAFSQIVNLVFQEWTALFGGNNGLYGIPKFSIFGVRLTQSPHYYALGLLLLALFYALMRRIERSDIGAIFESLNENEMLSRSMGSDAPGWRIGSFALSAFIAGVSGGVYAFYIGFLSPETFGFLMSVDLIVVNAIGGVASALGPVVGAILILPLPELLRDAREYQLLIYGVCLVVFLLFFRQGLVVFLQRKRRT
ncbi:ABC transporter permease [Advenella kashmirensis W13003]|uniref:ABC transporter permease n=1 Tax=Advenella kashmirensis W13003 TaxID=1424334 RepID=V8QRD6_9BURK|nr:branched-chain amino acid ABC transporter permease [Advenella kashmirensis]ETF02207.1 ABC transporter permease [Advenella kashmirensis W13003]